MTTRTRAPSPSQSPCSFGEEGNAHLLEKSRAGPPPKPEVVEAKRRVVLRELENRGLAPQSTSETLVYGYHDPIMTPNILRKNEVGCFVARQAPKPAGLGWKRG